MGAKKIHAKAIALIEAVARKDQYAVALGLGRAFFKDLPSPSATHIWAADYKRKAGSWLQIRKKILLYGSGGNTNKSKKKCLVKAED